MTIIGGADGPTAVFIAGKTSGISWLNVSGLILVILLLIPNIVFAVKHRDQTNRCSNRFMNKPGGLIMKKQDDKKKDNKNSNMWMPMCMCIGICIGGGLGLLLFDNYSLGMCMGMMLGVVIGSFIQKDENKDKDEE